MTTHKQNAHLTHKANIGVGRHGWLRLTPAYSVRLVRDRIEDLPAESIVTDPFSGTGTSALAAAEHGCAGQALDVNPFLVWLGNVKTRNYDRQLVQEVREDLPRIARQAKKRIPDAPDLWEPKLFKIERWWSPGSLSGLKSLRQVLDEAAIPQPGIDLLAIAFCRTLITSSNAAFNHQSMSFKDVQSLPALFSVDEGELLVDTFAKEAEQILASAETSLPGTGRVLLGDAREFSVETLEPCDLLITSPPYVNRMSYIRELRPYMYWLRYLEESSEAGELDWLAIGGTWGVATSRVALWASDGTALPIDGEMKEVCELIAKDGGKNGPLLANYVAKYFHDMFQHFQAAFRHVKSGGKATYIVGNSTFYGHVVPAQDWYASIMRALGFTEVTVRVIRKRNSKMALYEYEVSGIRP